MFTYKPGGWMGYYTFTRDPMKQSISLNIVLETFGII